MKTTLKTLSIVWLILLFATCKKDMESQIATTVNSTSLISETFDSTSLTNGLLAYYPFNGNANDESGNKHDGLTHATKLTKDRNGKPKSAYSFNGYSSLIKVVNDSGLNLKNSFSISCWFNMYEYASTYNGSMLVSKHDGDVGASGYIYCILNPEDDTTHQHLLFEANGIWGLSPNPKPYVTTNKWYNYVITYKKNTNTLTYYLNGEIACTQSVSINMIGNAQPLFIGYSKSKYGTYHDYFDGVIDEVRIYDRALNQDEITYLADH